jgi:dienelactone hydrolase
MAEHLATHGYIIAAPRFPLSSGDAPGGPTIADIPNQPGDMDFVMRQVARLGGPDADLAAAVDSSRRGVLGLSAGGETVLIAAYHPSLKIDVQSAVAQAPVSCFFGPPFYSRSLPMLILAGTADELVAISGPERAFALAPPPVTLVELLGGTHSGFMNREQPYVENSDTRECELLLMSDPMRGQGEFVARLIAGVDPGVFDPGSCLPLCGQRYRQTMGATRQLRLSRAATLAHFEATLRGRVDAALFLSWLLGRNPDVVVHIKR